MAILSIIKLDDSNYSISKNVDGEWTDSNYSFSSIALEQFLKKSFTLDNERIYRVYDSLNSKGFCDLTLEDDIILPNDLFESVVQNTINSRKDKISRNKEVKDSLSKSYSKRRKFLRTIK